jgi:hypothetical protein
LGISSADGIVAGEGAFRICTFWLVEALTRAGRLKETRLLFEKMLGYANFVWEVGHCGEASGNLSAGLPIWVSPGWPMTSTALWAKKRN